MKAAVSVIIPCYRCADTIQRAVDSVLRQTMLPVEILLVEDCSDDAGATLVALRRLQQLYPQANIRVVPQEKNGGPGSARNAGWKIAQQCYLAFLDADDSWHPEKLKTQYEVMSRNPEIALSGHQCHYINDENIRISALPAVLNISNISSISLLIKNPFSTPTVMVRRNVPQRFQEGKHCAEDFLLWQQIAFAGLRVVRLESPLAYVHKPLFGIGGLSAQLWKMEKGELSNFALLYSTGEIGIILLTMSVTFSLVKYLRRLCITAITRLMHRSSRNGESV